MHAFARLFASDPRRHEGVRPFNVWGLLHPLRWLPLMFFTIGYKAIWLGFVALPLWRAGALWGTPTGEIAASFLALPLLVAVVPWKHAWRTYFSWPRPAQG